MANIFGMKHDIDNRASALTTTCTWGLRRLCKIVFCQNFVKFSPMLIIFGRKMAKGKIMRGALIFQLI